MLKMVYKILPYKMQKIMWMAWYEVDIVIDVILIWYVVITDKRSFYYLDSVRHIALSILPIKYLYPLILTKLKSWYLIIH